MRVLVVEDYSPLRNSLVKGLRESGYRVDSTGDGEEGLWYSESNVYDAIVLDLMLPGLDGLSLLSSLREKGIGTPVLILTARDGVEDRVAGLDRGADDYLVKPFAFAELLARLNALIRRAHGGGVPVLVVADLSIDTRARSATKAGETLVLTAGEYMLLEFLVFRRGQIVTRREIEEHVYDFNASHMSNVIDVRIRSLRRKLERDGQPRLIHTRRGLGYILEEAR